MKIMKTNGQLVDFDPAKIRLTLQRVGARPQAVDRVIKVIESRLRENMPTSELFAILKKELRQADRAARRFQLVLILKNTWPACYMPTNTRPSTQSTKSTACALTTK